MRQTPVQIPLPLNLPPDKDLAINYSGAIRDNSNTIYPEDRNFHDWYRFVLSYPPHLVRDYISDFQLNEDSVLLDPFCGTGTTLVEAKLNRIKAIGLEANPFPCFATAVKTNWQMNPDHLEELALLIAACTYDQLMSQGIDDRALTYRNGVKLTSLSEKAMRALIKNSISPLPLHKTLVLLDNINLHKESPGHKYCILALGNALVSHIGNLRFGPEVGVGKIKKDVPVVAIWMQEMNKMSEELGFKRIKNLGDIPYSFRFRRDLPDSIQHGQISKAELHSLMQSEP